MTDGDYREVAGLSRLAGKALLRMAELFERAACDARRLEPNPEIEAARAVADAALAALDREEVASIMVQGPAPLSTDQT
jgi:hypothetical protein